MPALKNYQDYAGPTVSAAWLNMVDALLTTVFGQAATPAAARTALYSDAPLEVANGGTAARTLAAARTSLTSDAPWSVAQGGTGQTVAGQALLVSLGLTQTVIGAIFQPQTPLEQAKGVTPVNDYYPPGDPRRYGATGGLAGSIPAADDSAAWATAVSTGYVNLPSGFAFKIVTGASYTGKITVVGAGPTSELYSDVAVLTLTDGSGSRIDNFALYNITAPWIITRDPSNWAANISATLAQSNGLGYMPTVNDSDIWSTLTTNQQNQSISPSIKTLSSTANASDVVISRIYGRFVFLNLQDLTDSAVLDCDFRGGKGPNGSFGGIWFDNYSNLRIQGSRNRAMRNKVTYASFSGICFLYNLDGTAGDNICSLNGESGIKTNHGDQYSSLRMTVTGNTCDQNYYDGFDLQSGGNSTYSTEHEFVGNKAYQNGGDGCNIDGLYVNCSSNSFRQNYRYGILDQGSYQLVSSNTLRDNNQARDASFHEITSGSIGSSYVGNKIWMGAGANSKAIYCGPTNQHFVADNYVVGGSIFVGNPGAQAATDVNNIDATIGAPTEQCFLFIIINNAGTLQHIFFSDVNLTQLGRAFKVNGATSGGYTNTPTGADSTTAMAAGAKVGSASPQMIIFDTAAQDSSNGLIIATVALNTSGVALVCPVGFSSINVNGVIKNRLTIQFFNAATAAAFSLSSLTSGQQIQIQFYGKLA